MNKQMKCLVFINHKNDDLQFPQPHTPLLGDQFAGRGMGGSSADGPSVSG